MLKLDTRINKANLTSFYLSFVRDFYLVYSLSYTPSFCRKHKSCCGEVKSNIVFCTPIISWLFSFETCCGHAAKEKNR